MKYENPWMEYFDKNWNKVQTFLKLTTVEYAQIKSYNSDGLNNFANNTDPSIQGTIQYTKILEYWNLYVTDEKI